MAKKKIFLTEDGSTPASANLDIGNNKITNVAQGTANTDVARVDQLPSLAGYATETYVSTNTQGSIRKVEILTSTIASTSHTLDSSFDTCEIWVIGAGGGGASGSALGNWGGGTGGDGGSMHILRHRYDSANNSITYSCGLGGNGGGQGQTWPTIGGHFWFNGIVGGNTTLIVENTDKTWTALGGRGGNLSNGGYPTSTNNMHDPNVNYNGTNGYIGGRASHYHYFDGSDRSYLLNKHSEAMGNFNPGRTGDDAGHQITNSNSSTFRHAGSGGGTPYSPFGFNSDAFGSGGNGGPAGTYGNGTSGSRGCGGGGGSGGYADGGNYVPPANGGDGGNGMVVVFYY